MSPHYEHSHPVAAGPFFRSRPIRAATGRPAFGDRFSLVLRLAGPVRRQAARLNCSADRNSFVPVVNFQEVNVTETLNHYTLYTIFHTEMDWNTVLPCVALCERKAFAPAVTQAGREGLGGVS
jgi:hypothetical protein